MIFVPRRWKRLELVALQKAPLLFFALVFIGFSLTAEGFLSWRNAANIVTQSASVGILAVGMTFVLLLGRVDLSVGSVMFVSGAAFGKLLQAGLPAWVALLAMFGVALAFGVVNFVFIVRYRVVSFVVTLATLFLGRGLGLWMTKTRPVPTPPFEALGGWSFLGLGAPIWLFALVVALGHLVLERTQFGKQLYAVGCDAENARRAGIRSTSVIATSFLISSFCACIAAVVALTQSPSVSPEFGSEMEFTAIAAAVLGGVSLFGGKGRAFPGVVIGALLLQMVSNGLNIKNVDPYLYPMILGAIIFLAVLTDSQRNRRLRELGRRKIRVEREGGEDKRAYP